MLGHNELETTCELRGGLVNSRGRQWSVLVAAGVQNLMAAVRRGSHGFVGQTAGRYAGRRLEA